MGATASRGRSNSRPFVAGEFTVAWLTFKSDSVEDDNHRHVARKEGLLSSKLLRGLFGETTMKRFAAHDGEYISRELFICTLALNYEGNTEDRISFIFTMYSIIYGMEREHEGCINGHDYKALIEYWEGFDTIPKQFYTVFEECHVLMDGFLLNSRFIQWIRQYPVLMECLAHHLPPSQLGVYSPPSIQTSDEFIANSDALNKSPSCRLDKDKLLSSFDFIGGEDSGEDDSDEAYDSDQIPDEYAAYRGSCGSEEGMGTSLALITPSSMGDGRHHGPLTPTEGGDERVRRKRGPVQRGVRNISKTLNGGISKVGHVGRSILHVGKSSSQHLDGASMHPTHSSHTPAHLPSVSTPPHQSSQPVDATSTLLAAGYSFSSESQISRNYVCGYLQKISDGKWSKRSWHRRWFVLDRQKSMLSYYRYNPANLITTTPRGNIVQMQDDENNHEDEEEEQREGISTPANGSGGFGQVETVSTPKSTDSMGVMAQHMLYLNTSHPWYRGEINLNMENVSLLFEKSMAKNAPTPFYFQVSTLALEEIDSKRGGIQYKLCAENEEEFDRWTHAIAVAINKKQMEQHPSRTVPVLSHQQLYRQRLLQEEQMKMQQVEEDNAQSPVAILSPTSSAAVSLSTNVTPASSTATVRSTVPQSSATTAPTPPPTSMNPVPTTTTQVTTPLDPTPLTTKISPRIVTYNSSPKHPSPSSPWQLNIHIEGSKQCLIVGFMVNIVTLKCIAAEHAIIKVFVCIMVTCAYVLSVYTPTSTANTRRRNSRLYIDPSVDTNVLQTDFASAETCLDHEHCCLHKLPTETTEINQSDGLPSSTHGPTPLGGFPKFPLSSSMVRTEMHLTGKAGTIPQAWTTTRAESFIVRSREYKKTKRKEASQSALFEFLGADLIQTDTKVDLIAQRIQVAEENVNDKLFIINAQLPAYAPSVWATCDGPGYSLVLVWKIPEEVVEELEEPKSKVIRLLKRFLEAGDDTSLTDRFKVIAQVTNQDECGLTGMAKKLLVSHNATPVLTRPQHRIYHFNHGSTEVDVDIHEFSYIARKGIHLLLDKTSKLVIDISFVLQGETEEELPERILGCCRLDRVDVAQAMQLPYR